MKVCISCGRSTIECIEFNCPSCDSKLVRCSACRQGKNSYLCKCGFKGP